MYMNCTEFVERKACVEDMQYMVCMSSVCSVEYVCMDCMVCVESRPSEQYALLCYSRPEEHAALDGSVCGRF